MPKISPALRFAFEVVVNFGLPYAIFSREQPHLGDVKALIASSIPPILWSLIEIVWRRRIDALSLMVLAGIALGLLAFVGGGSVKFLQLRENLVGAIVAVVFLGSAAIGRPLMYELARAGMSRQSADKLAEFERLKDNVRFRKSMFVMTVVWGVALLVQTAISCVLVYRLPIKSYLIAGPIVGNVFFGALALWTFFYVRHRKRLGQSSLDG